MPLIQIGGYRGGQRKVEPVYAEVDDEDLERVLQYKWGQNKESSHHTIYAKTMKEGRWIHLHRFIMGLGDYKDDKRIIDHKDGNGLNNKKDNLVICDTMYNSQSFRRHHGDRSIGCVYFDTSMKRVKRWKACFVLNGTKHQQRFLTEQEARDWISQQLILLGDVLI
jgi:hypothetical protein